MNRFVEWMTEDVPEDLRPAKGIINGLIFSVPIWIIIGVVIWIS